MSKLCWTPHEMIISTNTKHMGQATNNKTHNNKCAQTSLAQGHPEPD